MTRPSPLCVVLIGAGYVARFHVDALRTIPNVRITTVCDRDRRRAERLAAAIGADACGSLDELDERRLDVAHVLTPPDLHVEVSRRLLARGMSVFIEKPMALSVADALALQADAARHGGTIGVNHNHTFHPAFRRVVSGIRAGRIGRLEHVRLLFRVPLEHLATGQFSHWMFQAPRNIVFEQAVHPLSQVSALVGPLRSLKAEVLSSRQLSNGATFHDRWLIHASGQRASAELHLDFGGTFTRTVLEVVGSDGCLEADLANNIVCGEGKTHWLDFWNTFLVGFRRGAACQRDALRGAIDYLAYTAGIGPRRDAYFVGMQHCMAEFYEALREGREPSQGAAAGVEVLRWCETIAHAAAAPAVRVRSPVGDVRPGEVVVLGATGLIGRRVVATLRAQNIPTTVVVRRVEAVGSDQFAANGTRPVRILEGRLGDEAALAEAVKGASTVIHLATGSGETWHEVREAMVDGTAVLGTLALAAGVRRFVFVSSIAALYPCESRREVEDSTAVDSKAHRRDIYSRGKAVAEGRLLELHREHGLPLVIVRPGIVLAPESPIQHPGLGWWPRDNHCLGWGRGAHPLPLVTADDIADAIVRVVKAPGNQLHGRALNLCSRVPLSAREMVCAYADAKGRPIQFHERPLWITYAKDIMKWGVKSIGRRALVAFPSYRDLRVRALAVPFTSRTAREELGWRPIEDRETFLEYLTIR